MKVAKVIPLFKSGDDELFNNYRPVSLLPQFSKILEKVFEKRLDSFINKYNLLSNSQYGFRNNRSTALALIDLIENITSAIDKRKVTIGVFIDLKKAFDTINHELLIKKLSYYGIRGVASDWLISYLNNRKQFVDIENNFYSDVLNVICGVPQGSILGPKLFILYINDLCNVFKLLNFLLFADDTNIFFSSNNIRDASVVISRELTKLSRWFAINKLSLNVSKTNYMVFTYKKDISECQIHIDKFPIERVLVTKFLVVLIDEKLTWKVKFVITKIKRSMAMLFKIKDKLKQDSLLTIYNAIIQPYLFYCCEV